MVAAVVGITMLALTTMVTTAAKVGTQMPRDDGRCYGWEDGNGARGVDGDNSRRTAVAEVYR
jgi:hypothetical protein